MHYRLLILFSLVVVCVSVVSCGRDNATTTEPQTLALVQAEDDSKTTSPVDKVNLEDKEALVAGPPPTGFGATIAGDTATVFWYSLNPGDYNVDGIVNGMDVFPLAVHFGETVAGNPGNECIDGNEDGNLNGLDLFSISVNFDNRIDGYNVYFDDDPEGEFNDPPLNAEPIAYEGCYFRHEYQYTVPYHEPTYFKVRAVDTIAPDFSDLSDTIIPDDPPPAPNGLTWNATTTWVDLDWQGADPAPYDFETWDVGRSTSSGGPYTKINTGRLTDWHYRDEDVFQGQNLFYAVRGVDIYGAASDWCEQAEVTVPVAPYPWQLTYRSGDLLYELGWQPYDGALSKWEIEWQPEGGGDDWEAVDLNFTLNEPDPEHGFVIFRGATTENNRNHTCRVRGQAADGVYGNWREVDFVRSSAPGEPVTGVHCLPQGDNVMVLWDWEPLTSYNVYRSETQGGPYRRIDQPAPFIHYPATYGDIGTNGRAHVVDDTVEPGVDYYYVVRNLIGGERSESDNSDEAHIIRSGIPQPPSLMNADAVQWSTSKDLSWMPPGGGGIAGYNVWRSADGNAPWLKVNRELVADTSFRDNTIPLSEMPYPVFAVSSVSDTGAESELSNTLTASSDIEWEVHEPDSDMWYGDVPQIEFDLSDNPFVTYVSEFSATLEASWFDGTDWTVEQIDVNQHNGLQLDMELDSAHLPGVAYLKFNGTYLMYAHHDGASWSAVAAQTPGAKILDLDLCYDQSDNPLIAYIVEGTDDLRLTWYDGSDWSDELVSDTAEECAGLVLDADQRPMIALKDSGVYLASFDGMSWNRELIPDSDGASSIGFILGAFDRPIVSFSRQQQAQQRWFDGVDSWDSREIYQPYGPLDCGTPSTMVNSPWTHPAGCHRDENGPRVDYDGPRAVFWYWDGEKFEYFPLAFEEPGRSDIAFDSNLRPAVALAHDNDPMKVYWYRE